MNIAAVTAHPDDAEFLATGTFVKYREKGHKITIIICTNGNIGHLTLPKEEIARIRWKEAKESAKLLGAEIMNLGYDDEFMPKDYVDITNVMDIKKEALLKHESQKANMTRMGTASDIIRNLEIQASFRGMQNQCMYTEAFIFVNKYPRAKERNLLPQYL